MMLERDSNRVSFFFWGGGGCEILIVPRDYIVIESSPLNHLRYLHANQSINGNVNEYAATTTNQSINNPQVPSALPTVTLTLTEVIYRYTTSSISGYLLYIKLILGYTKI